MTNHSNEFYLKFFENYPFGILICNKKANKIEIVKFNKETHNLVNKLCDNHSLEATSSLFLNNPDLKKDIRKILHNNSNIQKNYKFSLYKNSELYEFNLDLTICNLSSNLAFIQINGYNKLSSQQKDSKKFKLYHKEIVSKINDLTAKLNENEELFEVIAERSLIGINIIQRFQSRYMNKRYAKMFGYSIQEMKSWKGRDFLKVIHPDDQEKVFVQAMKKQKGSKNTITHYELRGIKKSGEIIWLDNYSKTINYKGENADLITIIDITDRKGVEEKLAESRKIFKTLADQSLMSIVILQDNKIRYNNNQFAQGLGYELEEVRNWDFKDFLKIIHPADRKFVITQARKKQKGEQDVVNRYQFRAINKSGNIIWREIFSKTITYKGKPANFITLLDITDQKEAEQKLKKLNMNYFIAYSQANLYKDIFVHDFSNIMQNIQSSSELIDNLIKTKINKEQLKKLNNIIKEQNNRSSRLISNIRKLSNLDLGDISPKTINLCGCLAKSISFLRNTFPNKQLDIKISPIEGEFNVKANKLLTEVFENILINAVTYNEQDYIDIHIKISKISKESRDFVKIEFIDNGIGVKDDLKEIIFQNGFKKKKGGRGMGLGLNLVKKIIESFDGEIYVKDKIKGDYEQGSNFVIFLPKID
ncbi:MAG: PAS domain S-box protein [Candidatus Lokiarchaeota archaeon]|nr:PAS domain S-box protein [Candidatus Lokiarchaeota archaeon]MBD3339429.1 PAS domain S-box protein [Candidatus Lokiarchaeota archaeon]